MTPDEYSNHALWSEMERVSQLLPSIDELGDSDASHRLDEVRELVGQTNAFRETEEMALMSRAMLNEAQSAWASVSSYLTTYHDNPGPNANYLTSAIDQLDVARDAIARFPRPQTSSGIKGAVSRALNEHIELLEAGRAALAERLAQAQAAATQREAEHAEAVRVLTEQIDSLTRTLDTLDARVTKDEARLDSSLTTTNDSFNTAQSARETAFKDWLSTQETEFAKTVSPYLASISRSKEEAESTLEVIKELGTSVEDMSNLAAGDILGGEYGKSASADRLAAFVGYGVGGLAGIASIVIVLFAFGKIQDDLEWQQVVLKLGLTAAAGGLAAVAFRFGGQALRRATSFKRQELELRALQPFLHGVVASDSAKVAFITRSFGHAWTEDARAVRESTDADSDVKPVDLVKLATTIAERIPKA